MNAMTPPPIRLNEDQEAALAAILDSYGQRDFNPRYLLTGYAGSGKTTLMQSVVWELVEAGAAPVVTAPTHKAVQVLRRKLDEAGLGDVPAMTIHALLGLKPAAGDSEKTVLKRGGRPQTGLHRAIIIDECSMIGSDMQTFIENDLKHHWVLYVGDPAQLPPVGEEMAPCFATERRSTLNTVVRQAAGNPILKAATLLRSQEPGQMDWSWCQPAEDGPHGIFMAGDGADEWMRDAFTSPEFAANNDAFRYVCYTNERVREVNSKVRRWIYGETPTPFVPGERVICRKPVSVLGAGMAFSTNEEAIVDSIEAGTKLVSFEAVNGVGRERAALEAWSTELRTWDVRLRHSDMGTVLCQVPQNDNDLKAIDRRLVSEAKANPGRWFARFSFLEEVGDLRCVYALTAHSSQGSTFDNVFLDVADCSKLERSNLEEMKKLLYVAVTRARFALAAVGSPR